MSNYYVTDNGNISLLYRQLIIQQDNIECVINIAAELSYTLLVNNDIVTVTNHNINNSAFIKQSTNNGYIITYNGICIMQQHDDIILILNWSLKKDNNSYMLSQDNYSFIYTLAEGIEDYDVYGSIRYLDDSSYENFIYQKIDDSYSIISKCCNNKRISYQHYHNIFSIIYGNADQQVKISYSIDNQNFILKDIIINQRDNIFDYQLVCDNIPNYTIHNTLFNSAHNNVVDILLNRLSLTDVISDLF